MWVAHEQGIFCVTLEPTEIFLATYLIFLSFLSGNAVSADISWFSSSFLSLNGLRFFLIFLVDSKKIGSPWRSFPRGNPVNENYETRTDLGNTWFIEDIIQDHLKSSRDRLSYKHSICDMFVWTRSYGLHAWSMALSKRKFSCKDLAAQEWTNRTVAEHACSKMLILCFTKTKWVQ